MTTNIASGLGTALGSAFETSYGSGAASPTPNLWTPTDSHPIKFQPVFYDGKGLRYGTLVQDSSEHVLVQGDAGGSIVMDAYYKGLGRYVATLFGSQTSGAPVQQGGTTAYKQTHAWGSPFGQSMLLQELIPDVLTGTIHNWVTLGVKLTDGEFTCTNGGSLKATFTVDGNDRFESASTPTVPTQISNDPLFTWRDMSVSLGVFGAEAKVDGIMKWTGSYKHSFADKRFNAGNLTVGPYTPPYAIKDQPIDNEFSILSGTLETEYLSDQLVNYFRNNTDFSLIVTYTSTVLAGTGYFFSISFAMPDCFLISDDPTVTGPDLVKPTMNYVARNKPSLAGSPAASTITIVSTETGL